MVIGSPGGKSIIMYVLKTIIAVLDWDMTIKDAVNFPNFSLKNNIVLLEKRRFDKEIKKYLLSLGHTIEEKKLNLSEDDQVNITSIWQDDQTRQVSDFKICFYDIPRGNLAAYYPETNPLVPLDSIGDRSYTPTSKSVAVYLEKSKNQRIV